MPLLNWFKQRRQRNLLARKQMLLARTIQDRRSHEEFVTLVWRGMREQGQQLPSGDCLISRAGISIVLATVAAGATLKALNSEEV